MIKATCPRCKESWDVPNELAGASEECPACKLSVTVPDLPPSPLVWECGHFEMEPKDPDGVEEPRGGAPTSQDDLLRPTGVEWLLGAFGLVAMLVGFIALFVNTALSLSLMVVLVGSMALLEGALIYGASQGLTYLRRLTAAMEKP